MIPDNYERDDENDKKEGKDSPRTLYKVHSTHTRSSRQEADNGAQKDYDTPIPSI